MNNLQDQGRACYKRGDYKRAIELFDRAIGRSPSVQLLDNRAACYEKLGDFQAALKDAKKTIQLHREDAVGYLRAGRVLVKMEKANVALEIYTHGLKSIKHVGQGYEQLRKMHKELMDRLCPPKSVDPLTVLPRELAETILQYLSFRQRMNACLVSKGWTQFIRSIPGLWSHLDLSTAQRKVRTAFISRAVNTARAKLKVATLTNLFDFDKTLTALIKHCQLEELILLECGYQGANLTAVLRKAPALRSLKITPGTIFSASELVHVMPAQSETLEVLDCWISGNPGDPTTPLRLPKLKSLSLSFRKNSDPTWFLEAIPNGCQALHSLTIHHDHDHVFPSPGPVLDLVNCPNLRYLDFHIVTHSLQHQLRVPLGLTTLKIDRQFMRQIPQCELPRLEDLSVHACGRPLHHIEHLLDTTSAVDLSTAQDDSPTPPSGLHTLSVAQAACSGIDDAHRLLSHPRLESLRTLCISGCSGVDDSVAAVIAASELKKLRYLDLTQAELTGVGVKVLVKALNLETLVLNDCAKASPDAVEWARAKGVTVKYRMSGEPSGGRKLRF